MKFIERIREFYSDKPILKHLSYMVLITIVLLWGLTLFLNEFTRQGETLVVPDFSGVHVNELEKFIEKYDLQYEVVDSIFYTGKEKGTVVSQSPAALTKVKKGRKIYLTIVSFQPEKIKMPNFKDLSLRQAQSMIETYGLRMSGFRYVPSQFKDAVLDQFHKGKAIAPGTLILKGSEIELIVGDGYKQGNVLVPFLYGMTLEEARNTLFALSLNVGQTVYEDCDSTDGRIYKQTPDCVKMAVMKSGESVDLYFKPSSFNFEALIKQKAKDTAQ